MCDVFRAARVICRHVERKVLCMYNYIQGVYFIVFSAWKMSRGMPAKSSCRARRHDKRDTYGVSTTVKVFFLFTWSEIKFANSPPCACRGSTGQKPYSGLMTLTNQRFTAVLLWLIYGSLFLSGVCYCLRVFWCAAASMSGA